MADIRHRQRAPEWGIFPTRHRRLSAYRDTRRVLRSDNVPGGRTARRTLGTFERSVRILANRRGLISPGARAGRYGPCSARNTSLRWLEGEATSSEARCPPAGAAAGRPTAWSRRVILRLDAAAASKAVAAC